VLPSEGKGHWFESSWVRHFFWNLAFAARLAVAALDTPLNHPLAKLAI
jgi:hypothetical protein